MTVWPNVVLGVLPDKGCRFVLSEVVEKLLPTFPEYTETELRRRLYVTMRQLNKFGEIARTDRLSSTNEIVWERAR